MSVEFFTYILALALMLYRAEIINVDQLKKLVEVCKDNSDKSIEDLVDELESINKK